MKPITRTETFLAAAGGQNVDLPVPVTRVEVFLNEIAKNGGSGGAPADWNAAEGEPGHVLGRTHYKELAEIVSYTGIPDGGQMLIATNTPLVVGNTYSVTYNGEEYTCTAFEFDFQGDGSVIFPAIGNPAMFNYDGTGEPFIIMDGVAMGGGGYMLMDLADATEVTVSIVGETYVPVPVEYLTNAFPYYIEVYGDNISQPTAYTCSDTVANVEAALKSGREITVKYSTADAISVMYQILPLVFVRPSTTGGTVLGFMSNGNFTTGATSTSIWIYLTSQEDGTYAVSDTFGD